MGNQEFLIPDPDRISADGRDMGKIDKIAVVASGKEGWIDLLLDFLERSIGFDVLRDGMDDKGMVHDFDVGDFILPQRHQFLGAGYAYWHVLVRHRFVDGFLYLEEEVVVLDRLDDKIQSLDFIAVNGKLGEVRDKNDTDLPVDVLQRLGQIDTVAILQIDVQKDDIETIVQIFEECLAIGKTRDSKLDLLLFLIPFQDRIEVPEVAIIIFDNGYLEHFSYRCFSMILWKRERDFNHCSWHRKR